MSVKFMSTIIFETDYWLPKTSEISIHLSPDPPSKMEIASELHKAMIKLVEEGNWADQKEKQRCKNTAEHILKYPPNKEWALNVIGSIYGTFNTQHPFFAKDYVKPTKIIPKLDNTLVPNLNDFFVGLPEPKIKGKAMRCTLVSETKQQRVEKALERLRLRRTEMEARMNALRAKFQDEEFDLV